MSGHRLRRKVTSAFAEGFCWGAVILALVPLMFILAYVIQQGLPALDLAFFTQLPKPVGEPGGGMANAIVGSVMVLGMAALFAVPTGVISGVYVSEFRMAPLAGAVRFAADVLNGVPSIVIGIFAYSVAVLPFKHFSALAGSVALGTMMLPIIVRTTEELLALVPDSLRQGALALGATPARAVMTVVVPAALPGIITGVLVALARIAGETAPLLFTAFNNRFWSLRPDRTMSTLTVQIFTYAIAPYDDWHRQAWAGAAVLIGAVLSFSLLARVATRRLERMQRGA